MKKKSVSSLKKIADKRFSIFIRKRGKGLCFICGLRKTWKEMQCGHFISRAHSITRYDETNCQSCCVGCNIFKSGNIAEFALKLDEKFGEGTAKGLTLKGRKLKQFSIKELKEIIENYNENLL